MRLTDWSCLSCGLGATSLPSAKSSVDLLSFDLRQLVVLLDQFLIFACVMQQQQTFYFNNFLLPWSCPSLLLHHPPNLSSRSRYTFHSQSVHNLSREECVHPHKGYRSLLSCLLLDACDQSCQLIFDASHFSLLSSQSPISTVSSSETRYSSQSIANAEGWTKCSP